MAFKRDNTISNFLEGIYFGEEFAEQRKKYFPTSINYGEGSFLNKFVNDFKPKLIVEIGLGYGISTLWMEKGPFRPKQHYVLDHFQDNFEMMGLKAVERFQLKNINFVSQSSQEFFGSNLKKLNQKVDLLFMDGDERFDGIMTDIYFATKFLQNGGVLIIRNLWNPSVRKAVMFLIKNLPFKLWNIDANDEWVIKNILFWDERRLQRISREYQGSFCILQKHSGDMRSWDHFVNF